MLKTKAPVVKKPEVVLTHENYYTRENTRISNSKVNDFLRSKSYFYRRYITREIEPPVTTPIKIGKIVDAIVSGEQVPYVVRALKRDDPDTFEAQKFYNDDCFVTQAQMDEAVERAQAITREPFYKWYREYGAKFQVILQRDYKAKLGRKIHTVPLCGMADIVTLVGRTLYIDDVKSVSAAKARNAEHWGWNCVDMGYDRQMAAYEFMAEKMYMGKFDNIVCRHIVVYKEQEGIYRVKLFNLTRLVGPLSRARREFLDGALALHLEKDFKDEPVNWDNIEELPEIWGRAPMNQGEWEEV